MTTTRSQEGGRLVAVPTTEQIHIHELGLHRHLLVSERLRLRRRQLGLTQKEVVARLRRLGVDTTNKSLSSLEHGAGLDVCKLPELARALDCTLTYLVGLSADPLSWQPDDGSWPVPEGAPERLDTASEPAPPETTGRTEGPWILGPVPAFRGRAR
jgi:transcriptional regulator with XRE-family HTH domain